MSAKSRHRLTAVDLFSGAGGMTVGLRREGFSVLGAVDIDPLAVAAYRANHRRTAIWETDIRKLRPGDMRRALGLSVGELDLLAACSPCQGFSSIRTLNGGRDVTDSRNALVHQVVHFAKEFRPLAVMVENVPALAGDRRSARMRRELRRLGYGVVDAVLRTEEFGVPQRRRRYVLVALAKGVPRLGEPSAKRVTVRDAIGALPAAGRSGDPLHDHGETRSTDVKQLIARIPHDGGSRADAGDDWQLPCHRRTDGFHDVYGRMAWDDVAPTITGGCVNPSKGRFLHPRENRAITLREAALLQTFPVGYRFPLNEGPRTGKYAVAELIGNALPPEFVRRQARPLAAAIRGWRESHD
jgi:DNA (cytosine-5)-methyltransferase 1